MAQIITNAPISGSSNSKLPTSAITANIGTKAFLNK